MTELLKIKTQASWEKAPKQLHEVIAAAIAMYREYFPDRLVGIYLQGSAGRGVYNPRYSDVDMMGVYQSGTPIDEDAILGPSEVSLLERFGEASGLIKFDFRVMTEPLSPLYEFELATDSLPLDGFRPFRLGFGTHVHRLIEQFPSGASRQQIVALCMPEALNQIKLARAHYVDNQERPGRVIAKNAIRSGYFAALLEHGVPYTATISEQVLQMTPVLPAEYSGAIDFLFDCYKRPPRDSSGAENLQRATDMIIRYAEPRLQVALPLRSSRDPSAGPNLSSL
jgi:hypothetical protein